MLLGVHILKMNESVLDVLSKVMILDCYVLGSRTHPGGFSEFESSNIVFKYFALDLGKGLDERYTEGG